jgi:hypothetical protein
MDFVIGDVTANILVGEEAARLSLELQRMTKDKSHLHVVGEEGARLSLELIRSFGVS